MFKKKQEKMLNFGTFWFNQNTGAEILTFWEISKKVKIQKKKPSLICP